MNAAAPVMQYFKTAARLMEIGENIETMLLTPRREISAQISVELDNGDVRTFAGYRCQHDHARGPMNGPLRFHPGVNLEEMRAQALVATCQAAVVQVPFGGSAGGIAVDPSKLSIKELERITRKYVDQLHDVIGPSRDITNPDVNTNPQVMAWMMDQYSKYHGHSPAVVTGKPLELYGSRGRETATARGLLTLCQLLLKDLSLPLKGLRIAVQGFGNVGSHAARLFHESGATIVAVSDSSGGLFASKGLDIAAVTEHVRRHGQLQGYTEASAATHQDVLQVDCDVLIPSAMGGLITRSVAEQMRAKIVLEGAYYPLGLEADAVLEDKKVVVVPDLLANAAGLVASHLEWMQNQQHTTWDEERVNQEIVKTMSEAYEKVSQVARTRHLPLRSAAWVLAIGRVGKATMLRGV